MATLKNLAPHQLSDYNTGVSDQQFTVGDIYIGADNRRYERIRQIGGTGSVTGRRFSMAVQTATANGAGTYDYTFDITDKAAGADNEAGSTQFSMMTAVTHFGWLQTNGFGPVIGPATTSNIAAGNKLYVSTTDKGAAHYIATTTNAGSNFATAIAAWGVTASVSHIVRFSD